MRRSQMMVCAFMVTLAFGISCIIAQSLYSDEQSEKSLKALQEERGYLTAAEKEKLEADQKKLERIEAKKGQKAPKAVEVKGQEVSQSSVERLTNQPKKAAKKKWYQGPWFDFSNKDPRLAKIRTLRKQADAAWSHKEYEMAKQLYNDLMIADPDHSSLYVHQMRHIGQDQKRENKRRAGK